VELRNVTREDNVQLVRRLYDAMARADMAAVAALMSDDVTFVVPGPSGLGAAGIWRGHEGVQQCFRKLREAQRNQRLEIQELVADDDNVVVLLHVTATVLSTGKMFESDIVHFFTVKGGKIVSLRDFFDTAAVVEASRS
jgi:uncharacterized protein (TIGR02246 family)